MSTPDICICVSGTLQTIGTEWAKLYKRELDPDTQEDIAVLKRLSKDSSEILESGVKENESHVTMRHNSDSAGSGSAEYECVGDGKKFSTLHA
jgi:hypothetical protein